MIRLNGSRKRLRCQDDLKSTHNRQFSSILQQLKRTAALGRSRFLLPTKRILLQFQTWNGRGEFSFLLKRWSNPTTGNISDFHCSTVMYARSKVRFGWSRMKNSSNLMLSKFMTIAFVNYFWCLHLARQLVRYFGAADQSDAADATSLHLSVCLTSR